MTKKRKKGRVYIYSPDLGMDKNTKEEISHD
jgi:hypothetical protein